jgi:hypothetical protein
MQRNMTELQYIPLIHKVHIKIVDRRPSELQLNFLAKVNKIIIINLIQNKYLK